ncbi:MAG TPA: RNA methyltransferase [Candidatus Sumerlaeota bacterium]|nr:RNA methyltransferase [Candidatus Sumerlaeota bacterium]HOR26465.1 RNA methyltransferase [Candidatus Sumerlaeota bacterium]HPK00850.1 RNA methyltransferase [Candidatus Sumerlaeota bacterium]
MDNGQAGPREDRLPIHAVLDNLRSAFNVGSIFRTSDAGRIAALHLCGMTPVPPHPRLLRTSLGAEQHVPWSHEPDPVAACRALRARGIMLVAIETQPGAAAHTRFDWPRPVALVFGHEVRGIRPDVLGCCDAAVRIPMLGHKNTLNVATAYGVVLYEILRQWRIV